MSGIDSGRAKLVGGPGYYGMTPKWPDGTCKYEMDDERIDGSSQPGGKHDGCEYFVLDLTHDKHALPALQAYADSCRNEYPLLADDLERIIAKEGK